MGVSLSNQIVMYNFLCYINNFLVIRFIVSETTEADDFILL